ncbi:hypothetical protein LMG27952_06772 [Paraburkholderia hiiakae]|uniref:Uncharacterized protein n=1 Tax=Paraburkholderia hiiakae TaxID=1081782 RepID=A0ABN7IG08_9BURK|nr:hypothetical protein LMG27952_06772 [Paraburkholderia hiiakae]
MSDLGAKTRLGIPPSLEVVSSVFKPITIFLLAVALNAGRWHRVRTLADASLLHRSRCQDSETLRDAT